MTVLKAPEHVSWGTVPKPITFLCGSIEMGVARDWQTEASERLPGTVLNPRRDDWDSSWRQSIDDPQFREQVVWELDGMAGADQILMHFEPDTKSPITLLELGINSPISKRMVVSCPDDFWRKGNVEVTCAYYSIPLFDNVDSAIDYLLTS